MNTAQIYLNTVDDERSFISEVDDWFFVIYGWESSNHLSNPAYADWIHGTEIFGKELPETLDDLLGANLWTEDE